MAPQVSQVTSATKWVEKRDAIGQLTALAKKHKKMVTAAAAPVGLKVRSVQPGRSWGTRRLV